MTRTCICVYVDPHLCFLTTHNKVDTPLVATTVGDMSYIIYKLDKLIIIVSLT